MRYYTAVFDTNIEKIKDDAKKMLRRYSYEEGYEAVNKYMAENLNNGLTFIVYREEDNNMFCEFSYDESMYSFAEAYDSIRSLLREIFIIKKSKRNPKEVSMWDYIENSNEARRREYGYNWHRTNKDANLWICDRIPSSYSCNRDEADIPFIFDEIIIPEKCGVDGGIYDKSFLDELNNIEAHGNEEGLSGNIVHYYISTRSDEATKDMVVKLTSKLYEANRISTRRVEIISNIRPEARDSLICFDNVVENNKGGTVVINLSERFGKQAVKYDMIAKYIEGLVKRYRNDCLFIFTYNMDNPGFAYSILPKLQDYILPIALREGAGNRRDAVKYLKALINSSKYAEYESQASEFMKQFVCDDFTQTDVLMAYQKFEPWCMNKNILKAYKTNMSEFMLDRDENTLPAYERFHNLIGLLDVKKRIDEIITASVVERERRKIFGRKYQNSTLHMVFGGNPGNGKTEVARLVAGIAKEKGIIKSGAFVATSGPELFNDEVIRDSFEAAKDGVLFIDEAYAMSAFPGIVAALIQELENHREDVIVIFAGYSEDMKNFMKLNAGLKSRVPHWIDFSDYNLEELVDIFKKMVEDRGFSVTDDAVCEIRNVLEKERYAVNFGNARAVRNLLDDAIRNQSVRLMGDKKDVSKINKKEMWIIEKEDITSLDKYKISNKPIGAAREEFEELIGLDSVKDIIRKAINNIKFKKEKLDRGIKVDNPSYHMVFKGNPGVAKTTVARLFAEILNDEKVLPTGNFVEAGRSDLVGIVVGETAVKVKQRFKEARGGVLFIDEAYALCDGQKGGYGDEAIATIVQEMENHREDTIVVLAGYTDEMNELLERNPGMASRIAFDIEFEDYTVDELCDITKLMAKKKEMSITDEAIKKLRGIYEVAVQNSDYGNGRFVRKMLEEAEMNVSDRLSSLDSNDITDEILTTIEADDIPSGDTKMNNEKRLGFVA